MIDFHSHILPCVDDGSRSEEESIELLRMLREQSVDTVFMTPHFYADHHMPDAFFAKRREAMARLRRALPVGESFPELRLGAEVLYFYGIERMEALPEFKLEGTDLLLLEMPVVPWSEHTVKELIHLSCRGDLVLMIAHIERYYSLQKPSVWERLLDAGILMQVNADFFVRPKTRRKALRMLRKEQIHLIGSDCHSLVHRPPRIGEATEIIRDKLGDSFACRIEAFAREIVNE